jgi:hypothetical protein
MEIEWTTGKKPKLIIGINRNGEKLAFDMHRGKADCIKHTLWLVAPGNTTKGYRLPWDALYKFAPVWNHLEQRSPSEQKDVLAQYFYENHPRNDVKKGNEDIHEPADGPAARRPKERNISSWDNNSENNYDYKGSKRVAPPETAGPRKKPMSRALSEDDNETDPIQHPRQPSDEVTKLKKAMAQKRREARQHRENARQERNKARQCDIEIKELQAIINKKDRTTGPKESDTHRPRPYQKLVGEQQSGAEDEDSTIDEAYDKDTASWDAASEDNTVDQFDGVSNFTPVNRLAADAAVQAAIEDACKDEIASSDRVAEQKPLKGKEPEEHCSTVKKIRKSWFNGW